ncbi:DUF4440 domain-containing protein [Vibrio ostreicida]|nr:DUF4440 domain-containing protein [Vibrio ostreicida]
MNIIIEQEVALHQHEVRQSPREITRLIHPEFKEVGRSGESFDFVSIMTLMQDEKTASGYVHAQDFECVRLEPSVQLLLYKSAWVDESGKKGEFTKRSSLWTFTGENWQLKYHQGTPCDAFTLSGQV